MTIMSEVCVCELCLRTVPETTVHHLIPRSEAKRNKLKPLELPTADLCRQCHKKIHSLFSNRLLGAELNTIALIRKQEKIQTYLVWVNKVSGDTVFKEKR